MTKADEEVLTTLLGAEAVKAAAFLEKALLKDPTLADDETNDEEYATMPRITEGD